MNDNLTLVILAAGLGSRYGGIKQMDGFGPGNEALMEYNIYDAKKAGFNKIVYVLREDILVDFQQMIGEKYSASLITEYIIQPLSVKIPTEDRYHSRPKPWGTAHAMLATRDAISEPFAVINADDYYGPESFHQMSRFLREESSDQLAALIGYQLVQTLSPYGSVSRGVCQINDGGYLHSIEENTKISRDGNGNIRSEIQSNPLAPDTVVSMNFWGFHPSIFPRLKKAFDRFISDNWNDPKAEYYIPSFIESEINQGTKVKVIPSEEKWFGITFPEDKKLVLDSIDALIAQGVYPKILD